MIARWMDVMDQNEFCFEVINAIIACVVFSTWWNNILWFIKTNFHFNLLKCCWLYVFQPNEKKLAMLFNLLKMFCLYFSTYWKKIWLCFSTCWKKYGYAFQPVEKILALLFNLLKKFWLCFSTSEKLYSMNFSYLKSPEILNNNIE